MKLNKKSFLNNIMVKDISNVVFDISTNQYAINTDNGLVTIREGKHSHEANYEVITAGLFDFTLEVPTIAMFTPISEVAGGDIVVENNKAIGWITGTEEGDIMILTPTGKVEKHMGVVQSFNNTSGLMVVKNIFKTDNSKQQGIDPMMLMLMSEKGDSKMDKLLPFLLMNQNGNSSSTSNNNNGGINPLMMMIMMEDGDDKMDKMLPLLLANGNTSLNPMMLMMMEGEGSSGKMANHPEQPQNLDNPSFEVVIEKQRKHNG